MEQPAERGGVDLTSMNAPVFLESQQVRDLGVVLRPIIEPQMYIIRQMLRRELPGPLTRPDPALVELSHGTWRSAAE